MSDLKLKKDKVFVSRMNGRIKDAFTQFAKDKGQTMSSYVERLIIEEMKKEGIKLEISQNIV